MNFENYLRFEATAQHRLCRADGSIVDYAPDTRVIKRPVSFWNNVFLQIRKKVKFFACMTLATFLLWIEHNPVVAMNLMRHTSVLTGIVTGAGINYMATAFTSVSNPINNFNFHTYGTGDVHGATTTPTNATAATPIVVTQAAHPFFTNDIIKLTGITGITGINGIWQITVINSSSYSLIGSVGGGSGFGGGTNAAQLLNGQADTALTTEVSSITRVAGTQSNPSSPQYRSVATVVFTGTTVPLTIIEWGLLSALTTGTLWDRRWMNTANAPSSTPAAALVAAPITITSTADSIQTTYTLTCVAGGS